MGITRISTNGQYQYSLNLMLAKQRDLAKTYQQVSTGSRMVAGADDPLGAGRAQQMDRGIARMDQYVANARTLQSRLNQQESVLAQAGDLLMRVRDLTVQANSGSLSGADRQSIASEVGSIRDQLLALANTDDGMGNHLFGGTQDRNAPFLIKDGGVAYSGDQNQRKVEVASGQQVDDTLPGSEVFMRIRTGNGQLDARPATGNTGTGIVGDFGITDQSAWNQASYQVVFTSADSYQIQGPAGTVTGSYSSGQTIEYAGTRLQLSGQPAPGDSFQVGASGSRDIFATLQALYDTLKSSPASASEKAAQDNALRSSLRDIDTATEHFIDVRAQGGSNLAAIDNANSLNESRTVAVKTDLSGIRDLDYAEALSRYSQQSIALEAAQKVFARFQQMSLFDTI
ncbi:MULTISPECIES: flagellar hook-associated protein FlgL [Gammaproteobacteria]|uniref:Flagellar hook-associated protein FlgL n=1 Tax=Xanthomonas boreopolis TaxID=86183 RepID=A0A919F4D3_9XANT|nr:flagellar hook-associated protein FlgL [Pseudomonas sp. Hp2]GHH46379.1 flagellar hook-associated protein FlgL [[Pseudomonas] boreopolis]